MWSPKYSLAWQFRDYVSHHQRQTVWVTVILKFNSLYPNSRTVLIVLVSLWVTIESAPWLADYIYREVMWLFSFGTINNRSHLHNHVVIWLFIVLNQGIVLIGSCRGSYYRVNTENFHWNCWFIPIKYQSINIQSQGWSRDWFYTLLRKRLFILCSGVFLYFQLGKYIPFLWESMG